MDLRTIILDYEKTIIGCCGNDILLVEGKYYSYEYVLLGKVFQNFIYIREFFSRDRISVYFIRPRIDSGQFTGHRVDPTVLDMPWFHRRTKRRLRDENEGVNIFRVIRFPEESLTNWRDRIKTVINP